MNGIRKLGCMLVAMGMAAFAMSAMAAQPAKLYSLEVCVGSFDASGNCAVAQAQLPGQPTLPTTLQVRVFNETPPTANSTINSFDFSFGVNWRVDSASVDDNSGNWNVDLSTPGHIRVSNLAPVKPQQFVTVTFTVDAQSCGEAKGDALVYTGSSFSGALFRAAPGYVPPTVLVACLNLGCGDPPLVVQPQGTVASNDPRYIQLTRGLHNADGTSAAACVDLYVYVTPTVTPAEIIVHTSWDEGQPDSDTAYFRYVVNLRSTSTTAPPTLELAWLLKGDGTPDFQPALFCDPKQPDLPAPYATLIADNDSKLAVDPTPGVTLPEVPFSIVIDDERLLVTKIIPATNTWFVTRATGGTSQITHFLGALLMSTPNPIVQSTDGYSSAYVGKPAKMCVNNLAHSTVNPNEWSATIIDRDGWIKGR